MRQPHQEGLDVTIGRIKQNSIMLPNFQRNFVWTEEEKQKKLVASVLTKLPVGSILLLKSQNVRDYACKQLGSKRTIENSKLPSGSVEFLLDGQQRMTVLSNVFSDVIFQLTPSPDDLSAPALRRRFFLRLPKYNTSSVDLFGVKCLVFPIQKPTSDEPDFLTQDILPFIESLSFHPTKDKDKCYNPYSHTHITPSELINFCTKSGDSWMRVPLFLLVENEELGLNHPTLSDILQDIARSVQRDKVSELTVLLSESHLDEAEEFIITNLDENIRNTYFDEDSFQKSSDEIRNNFQNAISKQGVAWASKMLNYLKSCISDINLSQISLDESQRARAIDIYENLNRGGVSLNAFDLIMARVAQVTATQETFYERLEHNIYCGANYPESLIRSINVKRSFQNFKQRQPYHAAEAAQCYSSDNNKFPKAYLDSFLNMLSLTNYEDEFLANNGFSVEHLKRQRKLNLTAIQIDNGCERCCTAIDRACFFFQVRCGIRALKEINYTLMIPIVAYILDNDDHFYGTHNEDIFNLIEAWYWASIFSGAYDKDQNQVMIHDLNCLIENVHDLTNGTAPNVHWIQDRRDRVLNIEGFSNCDFLLLNDAISDGFPKTVIGSTICQFFLAEGYEDLQLGDQNAPIQLTVFSEYARSLQVHHVIPLGSATTIQESAKELRKKKSCYLNSPLNLMYITEHSNQAISSKSLAEYAQIIPISAGLTQVCFSRVGTITYTSTDAERKELLQDRYNALNSRIRKTINDLLPG